LRSIKFIGLFLILIIFAFDCGGKKEEKGKVNTRPEINDVTIQPTNPSIQSEINLRILSSDQDGDPITYKVIWFVNGREIGEGMSFKYEAIKKGDRISAEVTPYDGKEWGSAFRTGEVVIGGLPPRILSLSIMPESLFVTTQRVSVHAMVEDPDRDTLTIVCHWLVNDIVISDTGTTLELQSFKLKKNDIITGTAFAYDKEFRSEPFPFELHIANSSPIFKTQIDSVRCPKDSVNYPLPIMDPDGDPLTFKMLKAPEGIDIDTKEGVVYGYCKDTTAFEVLVRATDTDGAYLEARFTLTPR